MTFLKKYLKVITLCCMTVLLFSCSNDDEEDLAARYTFGLSSAVNSTTDEKYAIETAYTTAYKLNGLNFGSESFAEGTSEGSILKACEEAEDAILTSSRKYEGQYIYEVKQGQVVIYHKIYGTK